MSTSATRGILFTLLVALAAVLPACGEPSSVTPLVWTDVNSPEEIRAAIDSANGKVVVVDFWATWCHYCKEYDKVCDSNAEVRRALQDCVLLRVDLSKDPKRFDLRKTVGLEVAAQPYFAIVDAAGKVRTDLALTQWYMDAATSAEKMLTSLRAAGDS